MRTAWKWCLGVSLVGLHLLILFTIGTWIFLNVGSVLMYMLTMGSEEINMSGISFGEMMSNFVGSPLFYMYLIDVAILITSLVGLIFTRKQKAVL